jgi:hypothetical protein
MTIDVQAARQLIRRHRSTLALAARAAEDELAVAERTPCTGHSLDHLTEAEQWRHARQVAQRCRIARAALRMFDGIHTRLVACDVALDGVALAGGAQAADSRWRVLGQEIFAVVDAYEREIRSLGPLVEVKRPATVDPLSTALEGMAAAFERGLTELGKGTAEGQAALARGFVEAAGKAPAPHVTVPVTVSMPDQTEGLTRQGEAIGTGLAAGLTAAGKVTAQAIVAAAEAGKQDGPQEMAIVSMPNRQQTIERDGDGKMSGSREQDA